MFEIDWGAHREVWPEVLFSVGILALGIDVSLLFLLWKHGIPPEHIVSTIYILNLDHDLPEVLLVMIPFGLVYLLEAIFFSKQWGQGISPSFFGLSFLLPAAMLGVFEMLLVFLYGQTGSRPLTTEWIGWANASFFTCFGAICYLEGYMSFRRLVRLANATRPRGRMVRFLDKIFGPFRR